MSDGYSSTFVPKPQWRVSLRHILAPRVFWHQEYIRAPTSAQLEKHILHEKGSKLLWFSRFEVESRIRVSRKTFFHAKSRDRLVKSVVRISRGFVKLIICFLYFSCHFLPVRLAPSLDEGPVSSLGLACGHWFRVFQRRQKSVFSPLFFWYFDFFWYFSTRQNGTAYPNETSEMAKVW